MNEVGREEKECILRARIVNRRMPERLSEREKEKGESKLIGRRCAHLLRVYEACDEQNERTVTFLFRDREDLPRARTAASQPVIASLGELFSLPHPAAPRSPARPDFPPGTSLLFALPNIHRRRQHIYAYIHTYIHTWCTSARQLSILRRNHAGQISK